MIVQEELNLFDNVNNLQKQMEDLKKQISELMIQINLLQNHLMAQREKLDHLTKTEIVNAPQQIIEPKYNPTYTTAHNSAYNQSYGSNFYYKNSEEEIEAQKEKERYLEQVKKYGKII